MLDGGDLVLETLAGMGVEVVRVDATAQNVELSEISCRSKWCRGEIQANDCVLSRGVRRNARRRAKSKSY